jgi:xanthine dehydrogenase YagT iron-sulfur-binding subunit
MSLGNQGQDSRELKLQPKLDVTLHINGVERRVALRPWTTLLDAVREYLDLTGTKKGCDHGQCGACTMLVNGRRIVSCLTLAVMQDGAEITIAEGHAKTADEIRELMSGNICRCGCYPNIIAAIEEVMHGAAPESAP